MLQKVGSSRCVLMLSATHRIYAGACRRGRSWPPWMESMQSCQRGRVLPTTARPSQRWVPAENAARGPVSATLMAPSLISLASAAFELTEGAKAKRQRKHFPCRRESASQEEPAASQLLRQIPGAHASNQGHYFFNAAIFISHPIFLNLLIIYTDKHLFRLCVL